ncbi:MAG: (Na+)-NQR maturation NqrM [Candidatus Latescibacteria bacterium]|nr:(Na+)-NQR maturation NqrM [Candidatus Latescibacterota bacterium]
MEVFLAAFLAFGLIAAAMAVGVIFSNRRLKGSCGGLGSMVDENGRPLCECGVLPGTCGRSQEEKAGQQLEKEEPVPS